MMVALIWNNTRIPRNEIIYHFYYVKISLNFASQNVAGAPSHFVRTSTTFRYAQFAPLIKIVLVLYFVRFASLTIIRTAMIQCHIMKPYKSE
jgi:hypothetical protein